MNLDPLKNCGRNSLTFLFLVGLYLSPLKYSPSQKKSRTAPVCVDNYGLGQA